MAKIWPAKLSAHGVTCTQWQFLPFKLYSQRKLLHHFFLYSAQAHAKLDFLSQKCSWTPRLTFHWLLPFKRLQMSEILLRMFSWGIFWWCEIQLQNKQFFCLFFKAWGLLIYEVILNNKGQKDGRPESQELSWRRAKSKSPSTTSEL